MSEDRIFPWCEPIPKEEYIVCAAIWYKDQPTPKIKPKNIKKGLVVSGHRHGDCIHIVISLIGGRLCHHGKHVQGFLTSKNRFVDRKEAAKIAFAIGQIDKEKRSLFSEDIY